MENEFRLGFVAMNSTWNDLAITLKLCLKDQRVLTDAQSSRNTDCLSS